MTILGFFSRPYLESPKEFTEEYAKSFELERNYVAFDRFRRATAPFLSSTWASIPLSARRRVAQRPRRNGGHLSSPALRAHFAAVAEIWWHRPQSKRRFQYDPLRPLLEPQATDRAFRIDQQRNEQVHRFITQGTFEEKINATSSSSKKELTNLTMAASEKWMGDLTDNGVAGFDTVGVKWEPAQHTP